MLVPVIEDVVEDVLEGKSDIFLFVWLDSTREATCISSMRPASPVVSRDLCCMLLM